MCDSGLIEIGAGMYSPPGSRIRGQSSGGNEAAEWSAEHPVPEPEWGAEDVLIVLTPAGEMRNKAEHVREEEVTFAAPVPYGQTPKSNDDVDLEALFPNRVFGNLMTAWKDVGWAEYDKVLGKGAYAHVHLGFRFQEQDMPASDRHMCAVKRMPCYRTTSSRTTFRRQKNYKVIWNEITALRCLSHSHIVRMYDAYLVKQLVEEQNVVHLILEYCDDGSLRDEVEEQRDRRFPQPVARYYFRQLVSSLVHMHGKGMCHGDLHGGNVVMKYNRDGVSKKCLLTDFGLATICWRRSGPSAPADFTESHSVAGHVSSLPPEQSRKVYRFPGDPFPYVVSGWESLSGDVWGLGDLLCLMLTGDVPLCFGDPTSVGSDVGDAETVAFVSKLHARVADRLTVTQVREEEWMNRESHPPATLPDD